jgi:hypothetical protein
MTRIMLPSGKPVETHLRTQYVVVGDPIAWHVPADVEFGTDDPVDALDYRNRLQRTHAGITHQVTWHVMRVLP